MSHGTEQETTIWPEPRVLMTCLAVLLFGSAAVLWRGPAPVAEVRVVLAPEPAAVVQPE
jgi:hypothetical protein